MGFGFWGDHRSPERGRMTLVLQSHRCRLDVDWMGGGLISKITEDHGLVWAWDIPTVVWVIYSGAKCAW